MVTMTTERKPLEVISEWFRLIGAGSNEPLYLNIEGCGRAFISSLDGEIASSYMDWDVLLDAPNVTLLAALLQPELDETIAVGEEA